MTYELPEPRIRQGERSYTVRYDTGQIKPATEHEREAKILFTINVGHSKAGVNYWNGTRTTEDHIVVNVLNETERENGVVGFVVGSGRTIAKIPDGKCFSRKRLDAAYREWKERIEGIFSVDPQMLSAEDQTILDTLKPYLNGSKAGLA